MKGDDRESIGGAQTDADLTVRVAGVRHQHVETRTTLRGVLPGRLSIIWFEQDLPR
ncbi:MAG: hypothetical protein IRY85_12225 [Micromonosporaceae bacterium]|nr:hypothetical protein [Micromonosporaceae bacterium]